MGKIKIMGCLSPTKILDTPQIDGETLDRFTESITTPRRGGCRDVYPRVRVANLRKVDRACSRACMLAITTWSRCAAGKKYHSAKRKPHCSSAKLIYLY
jgi:hypothetical protein